MNAFGNSRRAPSAVRGTASHHARAVLAVVLALNSLNWPATTPVLAAAGTTGAGGWRYETPREVAADSPSEAFTANDPPAETAGENGTEIAPNSAVSAGGWQYPMTAGSDAGPEAGAPATEGAAGGSGGKPPLAGDATPDTRTAAYTTPDTSTAAPAGQGPPSMEELFLGVEVNEQQSSETLLALRDGEGRVFVRGDDLTRLGLVRPDAGAATHQGESYYPLGAYQRLAYEVDMQSLVLSINAPASVMQGHRLSGIADAYHAPDEPANGMYLNYDLLATADDASTNGSGLFELGAFGRMGSLRSTQLVRELGEDPEAVRLATTWRRDFPESMRSLRAGDAIGFAGSWGRPVRFGGVQWGTEFSTRPGFITFPLPSLEGETALPATVDVYIDNSRRLSRDVPAGPFAIDDVPALTGAGEIELVVRDLLGREQTVLQPYHTSSRLLRDGLHEYSYEAGAEREAFGRASADYGRLFGTATHRLGITDRITAEARAELVEGDQQTAGFAVSALWPATGVWSLSLAGSRRGDESGGLLGLEFDRQGRRFGIGTQLQFTDEGFTQLGLAPETSAPGHTARVFAGARLGRRASLSLSYVDRFNRNDDDARFAQASLSWSVDPLGALRFAALYPWHDDDDPVFALSLARALGERRSLHLEGVTENGRTAGNVRIQKNPPVGPGSGYSLDGRAGDIDRVRGDYVRNTRHGRYTIEAETADGEEALRAGTQGSVLWAGGRPLLARELGDAFAVVDVPGQAGIEVYSNNQLVGETNADGRAVVQGLQPYERNPVRIDATQLPLDVQPAKTEWRIVPRYASAVRVSAGTRRTRGLVFRLLAEDGTPLPAGTVVTSDDSDESFPVGRDGFAYVTGLNDTSRLQAQWNNALCYFMLEYPETDDPLPDLGDITCRRRES